MPTTEKYDIFFQNIKEFNELKTKQKQRGLNDYNILTTVLKASDEVRVHSRMIASLLDPKGKHYQDTLFLEIFLNILDLKDFNLDIKNTKVYLEYQNIDLYITDGVKHLIIENKIWAEDQSCQIIRYINIIKNEFSVDDEGFGDKPKIDNMRVIYLTPREKEIPDGHRIDEDGYIYFTDDAKLSDCKDGALKNYKVLYKKISYKNEILNWLNKSKFEVQNITNLNEAIKQYISVVEMITNKYKGKVMSLEKYMDKNEEMYQYLQELTEIKNNIEPKFWKELLEKLEAESSLTGTYDIEYNSVKKSEIKIVSKLDKDKFIYITRSHNTYFGFSPLDEDKKLSSYFGKKNKSYWKHTEPKINFQSCNDEYWKIAKPSYRKETIEKIVEEIKRLDKKVQELKLIV